VKWQSHTSLVLFVVLIQVSRSEVGHCVHWWGKALVCLDVCLKGLSLLRIILTSVDLKKRLLAHSLKRWCVKVREVCHYLLILENEMTRPCIFIA
jgi:hypothetical protein